MRLISNYDRLSLVCIKIHSKHICLYNLKMCLLREHQFNFWVSYLTDKKFHIFLWQLSDLIKWNLYIAWKFLNTRSFLNPRNWNVVNYKYILQDQCQLQVPNTHICQWLSICLTRKNLSIVEPHRISEKATSEYKQKKRHIKRRWE